MHTSNESREGRREGREEKRGEDLSSVRRGRGLTPEKGGFGREGKGKRKKKGGRGRGTQWLVDPSCVRAFC